MQNAVLLNREALSQKHYVRKADPDTRYWFDFAHGKLNEYIRQYGDGFCLVIAGVENVEGDFFAIPFPCVKHVLSEAHLSSGKTHGKRWVGSIHLNQFQIRNSLIRVDIGNHYGRLEVLQEKSYTYRVDLEDEDQDYAIENRKIEIRARQKQSLFRRRIMDNFGGRCCISGVSEDDLLIASHIIPWAERVDTRLDPANGLCFFVLYDKLFDEGYFSISDDMRVIVTERLEELSAELRGFLEDIYGRPISQPLKKPINIDFLKYHRDNKLRK